MRIPIGQGLVSGRSENRVGDTTDQTPAVPSVGKRVTQVLDHTGVSHWKQGGRKLYHLAQALEHAPVAPLKSKKQSICDVLVAMTNATGACATHYRRADRAVSSHLPSQHISLSSPSLSAWSRTLRNAPVFSAPAATIRLPAATAQTRLGNAAFYRRYGQVIALLQQHGYLQKENPYAAIAIRLVIAAVDFLGMETLHSNGPHQAALAHYIAQDQRNTAHADSQTLRPQQQARLIRHWIEVLLFGNSVEDTIVDYLTVHPHRLRLRIPELHDWLLKKTYAQLAKGEAEQDGLANDSHTGQWIWHHVINVAMPLFIYHKDKLIESLPLSDPEFGQRHGGALFAKIAGPGIENMPQEQALALGKMLLAQLHAQVVPSAWRQVFMLPARIHHLLSHNSAVKKTDNQATMLNQYLVMQENYLQQHCPACVFQKLMTNYQTRPQIAADIANRRCPARSVEYLLNHGAGTCPNTFRTIYEDPTEKFCRQNSALANAYAKLDKLMVVAAWLRLGKEELSFINRAEINIAHTGVVAAKLAVSAPFTLQKLFLPVAILNPITPLANYRNEYPDYLNGLEIFIATADDEIRLYHLSRDNSSYTAARVSEPPGEPLGKAANWLAMHGEYFFDRLLRDPVLKNDGSGNMLNTLCNDIVERHRIDFYRQMSDVGFHATEVGNIGDFALPLIHFYTCITEAGKGDTSNACSIDIVRFPPVAGQIAEPSIRFGETFYRGARIAITASREMAARTTLQAVLAEEASALIKHGIAPAANIIGMQELKSLNIAVGRTADPGMELVWTISKSSIRRAVALGKRIQHYIPALDKILSQLTHPEEKLSAQPHLAASMPEENAVLVTVSDNRAVAIPHLALARADAGLQHQPPSDSIKDDLAAGRMASNTNSVSSQPRDITGADIRNWRNRLLQLNALENNTMLKFAKEHQLELSMLLNFVRNDGSATPAGIRLMAQEQGRESPNLPSEQLVEEWNTSPRNEISSLNLIQNHGIDMFNIANRHAVVLEDFSNSLPVVQIMTQSGQPLLSESGAKPMFGANVVLLPDEGTGLLPQDARAISPRQRPAVNVAAAATVLRTGAGTDQTRSGIAGIAGRRSQNQ